MSKQKELNFQMSSEDMVLQPPSKAPRLESSCYFSSPLHFSDVVLVVEGRKFHVHKSTLSRWSPVFEKMFSSGFREKKSKEISLPGKNADEFEVLLNLIYSFKTFEDVTDENYEFLLKLADEYQVERVKGLCAKHMSTLLDFDNSIELCKIADQYALNDIVSNGICKASKLNMKSIESNPCYSGVSDGLKVQILTHRIKHLEALLNQYSSTCSSLVDEVYATISKKVRDCGCHRYKFHNTEKVGDVLQPKKFDLKCKSCIQCLENKWPEKDTLTIYLKGPLKKLTSYQKEYGNLNLGYVYKGPDKFLTSQKKHPLTGSVHTGPR